MANCPGFHGLKQFKIQHYNYKCDQCSYRPSKDDTMMCCHLCDYNLCKPCCDNYVVVYSQLINMGFSETLSLKAASKCPNNIDEAVTWISSNETNVTQDAQMIDIKQDDYSNGLVTNKIKQAITGLHSLYPYKDIIIEYIQINYVNLLQKDEVIFSNSIANHCGNKQLCDDLTELYKRIFAIKTLNTNIKRCEDKSAYNQLLCNFMNFCEVINDKNRIKIAKWDNISKQQVIICGLLSKWIYDPKNYQAILNNTNISIKTHIESKGNHTTKWCFLVNEHLKIGYIVFRGTASGESLGIDVLTDISIIPTPIWVENENNNKQYQEQKTNDWIDKTRNNNSLFDFAVHSGIYAAVLRSFTGILSTLHKFNGLFDKLYVTGHSLGGGLAILFGLQLLLRNLIPKHIKCNIVTFGSPQVISLESKEHTNMKSQLLLSRLHSMTHCFINKFDIVPRVPSQWILDILLPVMPKILKMVSSGFIMNIGINMYAQTYVSQLRDSFIKHQDILNTFQSVGTVYFLLHDTDKNVYIIDDVADTGIIKQILSFIPPVKRSKQELDLQMKPVTIQYILAHYFYKYVNESVTQTQLLIQQKYLDFEHKIYEIKDSSPEYGKIKKYLFSNKDWLQLVFDHYIDNYL
eukprot:317074_1